VDDCGLDLLEKMLLYEPSARISARQALNHPWFDDVEKPDFNYQQQPQQKAEIVSQQ